MKKDVKKIIEENPVAFVKVKDDRVVITNNYMTNTIKNSKNNTSVSLAVWNKDWKRYQINGKAEYFENGEWHNFVKAIEDNKDEPCKGAIVVEVNKIKRLI